MIVHGSKPRLTTWYAIGRDEALEGRPSDPPMGPGHTSYRNYMDGYRDGEKERDQ